MTGFKTLLPLIAFLPLFLAAETNFIAVSACRQYEKITQFSAETRRTTAVNGGKSFKTLSTVYLERQDKFHSETVKPYHRRVICDGKVLKYVIDNDSSKGVFCPVEKLPPQWLANIRTIPGTPEHEVMAIPTNAVETILPPLPEYPLRASYTTDASVITVDIDSKDRICKLKVHDLADQNKELISVEYSNWTEAIPGIWIPKLVTTVSNSGSQSLTDTLRLDNISVNTPIPQGLFKPDAFFKGVDFEALQ